MATVYEKIMRSKVSFKKRALPYIIPSAVALVIIGSFYALRGIDGYINVTTRYFSVPVRGFLGKLCSKVPFSVMEILIAALILYVLVHVVITVIRVIKSNEKFRTLLKRAFILLMVALMIFGLFCYTWGVDNYAPSFCEKCGISVDGIERTDLIETAKLFAARANEYASKVKRDENGNFAESLDDIFAAYPCLYDGASKIYPILKTESYQPKQMRLFSWYMSLTGFTGDYFPFVGESNININAPSFTIPFTIAHELAHQRSVTSEQECNYIGVVVCLSSHIDVYAYSGYFVALIHLLNALSPVDQAAVDEIVSTFSDDLKRDWNANNIYWAEQESVVSEIADTVYDGYLKSNGQPLGSESYGACVDLIVWHCVTKGF